jgi:23S rRNA (cytosine1962-C5)-methyltransferase
MTPLSTKQIHALVARALARREPLASDPTTDAYRLVNGAGDELPGFTVDRYGPLLVVSHYEQAAEASALAQLIDALDQQVGVPIYLRRRPRRASGLDDEQRAALAPTQPVRGSGPTAVVVREHGLRYEIRTDEGLSVGLFLDMRPTRRALSRWAAGKTVLNTFAYTCAFGVAALHGGATRVLNLDAARPALEWGKANYAHNDLVADPYDFVYGDVFDWLGRFGRRGERFDIVAHDYDQLAALAAHVVAPGGTLLACANHGGITRHQLGELVARGLAAAGRRATLVEHLHASPIDFPVPRASEGALKVLAFVLQH